MIKFKPCQMCDKTDRLSFMPKDSFVKLVEMRGHTCVKVECNRCDIVLYDFSESNNFAERMGIIAEKWNKLPRRGDTITKDERREMAISTIRDALDALERAQAVGGDAR